MAPLAGHTGEVLGGALSWDGKGLSSGEIEIALPTRDAKSSERVAAARVASNPVSCDIVSTSVGESLRAAGGQVVHLAAAAAAAAAAAIAAAAAAAAAAASAAAAAAASAAVRRPPPPAKRAASAAASRSHYERRRLALVVPC
jgi:hypothetical protein